MSAFQWSISGGGGSVLSVVYLAAASDKMYLIAIANTAAQMQANAIKECTGMRIEQVALGKCGYHCWW